MEKTVKIILAFIFLHSCIYSQLRIDVETFELPNVEKLIVEEESGDSLVYYFNDIGKINVTEVYYSDYLGEAHQYFYNQDGKIERELTSYVISTPNKTDETKYVYEYDSQKLLRKKIQIYDNKDSIIYLYKSYDLNNLPTEYFQYAPDTYNTRIITKLEYEDNKVAKYSTIWSSDSSKNTVEFNYNEFGDIVLIKANFDSKRQSYPDSLKVVNQFPHIEPLKHFIKKYTYEYDKMKRPIRIFKVDDDKKILIEKREYFDKKD